jgi:DNA-binding HxlR family transcriptional regulator
MMLHYIMSSKFAFLERSGSPEILMALFKRKGQMYFTELKENIGKGSLSTMNMRIFELKAQGLVDDKLEDKFGGRRYIWLTERGKKVAEHLLEIEKIL